MEKAVTTPDQYPLTLNALTNACNQKSSRDPVYQLSTREVETVAANLTTRHLVTLDENFRSRVKKYSQRLCGTPFSEIDVDVQQQAILCLLLLRGPQTPGELRSRSGRLATFADNDEVRTQLEQLMNRDGDPLVYRLPRTPGRLDHEYAHCFFGVRESASEATQPQAQPGQSHPASSAPTGAAVVAPPTSATAGVEQRVAALEKAVEQLTARLNSLEGG